MKSSSIIQSKFLRSRTSAVQTKIWSFMEDDRKKTITEGIELLLGEEIILCFFPDQTYWWLLTNLRLIINEDSQLSYIQLSEVEKVDLRQIFENNISKYENESIVLYTVDGEISLKLEKLTWPIIYEVLKFATSHN